MTPVAFTLRRRPFLARLRNSYRLYRRMFPPFRALRHAWRVSRP